MKRLDDSALLEVSIAVGDECVEKSPVLPGLYVVFQNRHGHPDLDPRGGRFLQFAGTRHAVLGASKATTTHAPVVLSIAERGGGFDGRFRIS